MIAGYLRRRRFRDVVRRQLALFEREHGDLVDEARVALADYHASPEEIEALEHYQRHDDLSEDVEHALFEMCDAFGATLGPPQRRAYRREFDHQARRRFRDVVPRLNIPPAVFDVHAHEEDDDEPARPVD